MIQQHSLTHVFVGGFQDERLQLTETLVYAFTTTSLNQRLLYLQTYSILQHYYRTVVVVFSLC